MLSEIRLLCRESKNGEFQLFVEDGKGDSRAMNYRLPFRASQDRDSTLVGNKRIWLQA